MRSVLIVDDDPRNTFALSAVLRARGYHCSCAGSADAALEILRRREDTGIVLIDMMMPGTDGYEAIPLLRAQRDIPVIAVTAQAMVGDREKCLQAGADDYVSKPVDVDKLQEILSKYLK